MTVSFAGSRVVVAKQDTRQIRVGLMLTASATTLLLGCCLASVRHVGLRLLLGMYLLIVLLWRSLILQCCSVIYLALLAALRGYRVGERLVTV